MKKLSPYLIALVICFFGLIPAGSLKISTPSANYWSLSTQIVLFICLAINCLQIPLTIRILSVLFVVNCFTAVIPFYPFVALYSITIAMYFFYGCIKLDNWKPIFNILPIFLLLNIILFFAQVRGTDSLFNWDGGSLLNTNAESQFYFGSVGQHMQMASFSVILSCLLIIINPIYFIVPIIVGLLCMSTWNFFTVGVGISAYVLFKSKRLAKWLIAIFLISFICLGLYKGKFNENTSKENGRWLVWTKTLELAKAHPWIGHGVGTYKVIFHKVSPNKIGLPWLNAHNFIVQMLFEVGIPITVLFISFWFYLVVRLFFLREAACVAGLLMMASDMLVHFPDRQLQCIFLMIAFLAFCYRRAYGLK